ncbi:MAG TPA: hypothetical protein VNY30_15330 [Bryobacteraceae bacterium]|jgi:hypothetical protein|nr:hypothetical protein [Bryobacteraceae bacterium]
MTASPGDGLLRLLEVFDRLEIPYMIGGSGASSVHGLVRTTGDVDIVANVAENVQALVSQLQGEFYIDEQQVRAALEHGRSFNVIHYRSSYKFDIFPVTGDRYQQVQFGRRRYEISSVFTGELLELAVSSPEDVILSKLRWYRQGGEVSEQQWNDVLGVIAAQRERLDLPYLGEWAQYLGVADLLEQALAEGREPH